MAKKFPLFKLFAVVAAAMMCALGASAYEFSMPNVVALPGQEVTIPVSLQSDAEDVAAYQFRLTCPEAITIVGAEATDRDDEDAMFSAYGSTQNGLNTISAICTILTPRTLSI